MATTKNLITSVKKRPLSLLEEGWGTLADFFNPTGLSVSDNDKSIFVEAQLPGLKEQDIQVRLEDNVLWITGEKKEEKSDKRYYQKASSSFSYKLALPKGVNLAKEPECTFENGELKLVFAKNPEERKTRNIPIKKSR